MTATDDRVARQFADDPAEFFEHSRWRMQHVPSDELAELQLAALRLRFIELRDEIPTLHAMADEQGITELNDVTDVVPLLFQHSVYKSYPASLLERHRFAPLTQWLGRLSRHDLSAVDVGSCETIDEWLDVLDRETPLWVSHSSGTSGTMSFLPRSQAEFDRMFKALRCGLFQFSDPDDAEDHSDDRFEFIWPAQSFGRSVILRAPTLVARHIAGSPERIHAVSTEPVSSDTMFLAGRIRAAEARGELDRLELHPAIRARAEALGRARAKLADRIPAFVAEVAQQLQGQRVWSLGAWNNMYQLAKLGLELGRERVFAPDSLVTVGGGAKGQVIPDDWEEVVQRFFGVARLQRVYAMTELMAHMKMCDRGRYHLEPWLVPFVLDPDSGQPAPREGEVTGRGAFFDLMAESYWGGFITGDEITLDWVECECGATTAHLARRIERYSEKRGGDDKITCAASDAAHERAVTFLNASLS
jgi:hypothetical protein